MPVIGKRKAHLVLTLGGPDASSSSLWDDAADDPESEWIVREWDGRRWRLVAHVQGRAAVDALLMRAKVEDLKRERQ